tara:strand:+ start:996 stop:1679 length:684 start_codon:yes stop_codon:yes gene_type:complete
MKNPIISSVDLRFDVDAGRRNFSDNFTELEKNNRHECDVFFYTQWGDLEKPGFSELFSIHKNSSKKNLIEMLESSDYMSAENDSRDELLDEAENGFTKIEEFREAANNAGVKFKENFTEFTTRGYSQGDQFTVIAMTSEYLPDQQMIDNYAWDVPIYGCVEIQDREFQLHEINGDIPDYLNYPEDTGWIGEKILEGVAKIYKHAPALKNILASVKASLPSEIKYDTN